MRSREARERDEASFSRNGYGIREMEGLTLPTVEFTANLGIVLISNKRVVVEQEQSRFLS